MAKQTPFRRLLISKDKEMIIITNAMENMMVSGIAFSKNQPNGVFDAWYVDDFEDVDWDELKNNG